MKVAGYRRVSTQKQKEKGESLKTQRSDISHFVKGKKNWKLVNIYSDEGISGAKTDNRPGFKQMIEDAKDGKFEGIVFSRLSRFARNTGDFLRFRDELKENGVQLFSIKENIDPSTHTGKLMMGLMALIAEWDRENIREQMSENKHAKWSEKRTFIGQPPFGYIWNKELNKLEINKAEARIYKRIVSIYLDLGISFQDIAIKLQDEGIRCKKKYFTSATISGILKNPAYYGHYVVNKHKYGDSDRGVGTVRTKELKPESEHITFDITALISKTKWDKLQEKTNSNKLKSKRSTELSRQYILRDLLVCGECGARVKPNHGAKRKDGSRPRYYSCYWASTSKKELKANNRKKCKLPYIKAEELEFRILNDIVTGYLLNPNSLSSLVDSKKYKKEFKTLNEQIKRLESDLKNKNIARDRIHVLYESGKIDINEITKRLSEAPRLQGGAS